MRLSDTDIELFYKLYHALLCYVARNKLNMKVADPAAVTELSNMDRMMLRDTLFEDISILEAFSRDNPYALNAQELDIVRSWKHFVQGDFCVLKQLQKHAIFLTIDAKPEHAYGVVAIFDLFEDILPFMPALVVGVLLPFKGQIIYDGLLLSKPVMFGGGIKRSFNQQYSEIKARQGVTTTLPPKDTADPAETDANLLKFYLRSEKNRREYWPEIEKLYKKNKQNRITFYQESGKYHAKWYGRKLREHGIERGWFGLMDSEIVASGKTRQQLLDNIESIVPKALRAHVYLFELKARQKA